MEFSTPSPMKPRSVMQLLATAVAVRILCVLLGLGEFLAWRVETSTPQNSLLSIREGVALSKLGISPYTASSCRIPPLVLWALSGTALHRSLYVLPNILCDLLSAWMLRCLASTLLAQGSKLAGGGFAWAVHAWWWHVCSILLPCTPFAPLPFLNACPVLLHADMQHNQDQPAGRRLSSCRLNSMAQSSAPTRSWPCSCSTPSPLPAASLAPHHL